MKSLVTSQTEKHSNRSSNTDRKPGKGVSYMPITLPQSFQVIYFVQGGFKVSIWEKWLDAAYGVIWTSFELKRPSILSFQNHICSFSPL